MNFLYGIIFVLTLFGCGVDTSSSQNLGTISDSNTSVDTNTSTDTNTSVDTNTSTDTGVDSGTTPVVSDPIFDTSGLAEYDENACRSAYATAVPLQDHNENDDREKSDDANGIALMSFYTETGHIEDNNVIAFYKTLTAGTSLSGTRKNAYGDNSQYRVEYDLAWVTEPNNTIYIETPQLSNKLKSCFRMVLDSENGLSIQEQKVYR